MPFLYLPFHDISSCRDLLLALHNVPQEYNEAAIRNVLQELTPANARIMWSSKLFQVSNHVTPKSVKLTNP